VVRLQPVGSGTRGAAEQALAVINAGGAFSAVTRIAMGPRPSPDLVVALAGLGDPAPVIRVRCKGAERCGGYRLTRWTYDPQWQAVAPVHAQTRAWTHGAPPWLDRANAGKGRIQTAGGPGAKHDGLGTHNYRCPRCGRNVPVTADRRFRLYLQALATGQREIFI
jgi:hypothetical protein